LLLEKRLPILLSANNRLYTSSQRWSIGGMTLIHVPSIFRILTTTVSVAIQANAYILSKLHPWSRSRGKPLSILFIAMWRCSPATPLCRYSGTVRVFGKEPLIGLIDYLQHAYGSLSRCRSCSHSQCDVNEGFPVSALVGFNSSRRAFIHQYHAMERNVPPFGSSS
jgi:hypothetical protein